MLNIGQILTYYNNVENEKIFPILFLIIVILCSFLGNGDYFADYALYHDKACAYSVVASIPCDLIVLTKKDVMDLTDDTL